MQAQLARVSAALSAARLSSIAICPLGDAERQRGGGCSRESRRPIAWPSVGDLTAGRMPASMRTPSARGARCVQPPCPSARSKHLLWLATKKSPLFTIGLDHLTLARAASLRRCSAATRRREAQ